MFSLRAGQPIQPYMADIVMLNQMLARSIKLADQVAKAASKAKVKSKEHQEFIVEIKSKSQNLAELLRQAAPAICLSKLYFVGYDRPIRRIVHNTEQSLLKSLSVLLKCRTNCISIIKRAFTIPFLPTCFFRIMLGRIDCSIGDVEWLIHASAYDPGKDGKLLRLPPISFNQPLLCFIWEKINGVIMGRSDSAACLVELARNKDRYSKMIVEEGGVGPLLKLMEEGTMEGQENAARALGLLGRDPETVQHLIHAGVCQMFAKILKEGPLKVQAMVAWALSSLVTHYPECQDVFAQHNAIRLLVTHLALACESVQEHGGNSNAKQKHQHQQSCHNHCHNLSGTSIKGRELEDPATEAEMREMSARALWHLAKENSPICRSIAESGAMLCFAVLLEKGHEDVQRYSALALMEITAVAEKDAELRRCAFRPNSPAWISFVDQILKIIDKADSDSNLLIPCIKTIGNLAGTFPATETRMIDQLVRLLNEREFGVTMEVCIALTKFACTDNCFHIDHSKAIISAGGSKHLMQIVDVWEPHVQILALGLMCYIALHVPDSEELDQAEVLAMLEWASEQSYMTKDETLVTLLREAKSRLSPDKYRAQGDDDDDAIASFTRQQSGFPFLKKKKEKIHPLVYGLSFSWSVHFT